MQITPQLVADEMFILDAGRECSTVPISVAHGAPMDLFLRETTGACHSYAVRVVHLDSEGEEYAADEAVIDGRLILFGTVALTSSMRVEVMNSGDTANTYELKLADCTPRTAEATPSGE